MTKLKDNHKLILFVLALFPFLMFGVFKMYFRDAQNDLISTFSYPYKKFPVGLDTTSYSGNNVVDTVFHTIPYFNFQNQFGQYISNEAYKNKIYVADFFFTSCPVQCPKMTKQMKSLQDEFIRDDKIMFVSFSIDPKRDTVEKLEAYAEEYGVIPGKWNLLTGDRDTIYQLANYGFFLSAADEKNGQAEILHSDRFVLIDPNGNIRGFYIGTDEDQVKHMKGDIALLLSEFKVK